MPSRVVKVSSATYTRVDKPSTEFYVAAKSKLRIGSGLARSYVFASSPAPLGASIASAYIDFPTLKVTAGTQTWTLQRIAKSKPFQQLNYRNRPATAPGSVPVAVAVPTGLRTVRFDVTADYAAFAAGAKNYGFTLGNSSSTTADLAGFQAKTGGPTLTIVWSMAPAAPTGLNPSEGAVSIAKPTLQWTMGDDITAVEVQIDADAAFTTGVWSSGAVTGGLAQLDLAGTSYPGLALGATAFWRVRVQNTYGWSPWSLTHSFSRIAKPVVTISNPGTVSSDATPPVVWSSPGQTAWRVVTRVAGKIVDDSGYRSGADTDYTPAKGATRNGQSVEVQVLTRDAVERDATPGDRVEAVASRTYTLEFSGAVVPVTTLDVAKDRVLPCVWVTFTRAEIPDEFAVFVDGVMVARFDGIDALDGGVYTFCDWTADPARAHTYRVAPIVNGAIGAGGPERTITPLVDGIWVIDPETGRWFTLAGTAGINLAETESSSVYVGLSAVSSIVRRSGLRAIEGTVQGILMDHTDRLWHEMQDDLTAMRETNALTARLVLGDMNIPVVIRNLSSVIDAEEAQHDDMRKVVTFEVYQQPDQVATL